MKKMILLGVGAMLTMALVFLGPELLDLYRLDQYISASDKANQEDGGAWPRATDACIGCHGFQGNSQHQGYPSLAGQPAAYVVAQLHGFASGQRANPTMAPLAANMSDAEIQAYGDYFAKQTALENHSFSPDAALAGKGRQLVAQCVACHGERLMGREQFPRLAGQGHDYLLAQLGAFADGRRKDPSGAMNGIAAALSTDDRKAMASYLADLAPKKGE